ncbi:MAG: helix-turn-helix domain-containing protein [Enterobacterales bacterium]|nr:helix-turn-helix domain-containing protein [Enterobacterales bacterium]
MNPLLENAMQHWNMVAPAISCPSSKEDYDLLVGNIQEAIELVENRPNSPLTSLIEAMAAAAEKYESKRIETLGGGSLSALKYLIKLHGIRQCELREIGSQGVVSEILNGKRSLTLRHIRELSRRFNVSPNVFIRD